MKAEELLRLSRKENKLFMLKIEKLDAELKEANIKIDGAKSIMNTLKAENIVLTQELKEALKEKSKLNINNAFLENELKEARELLKRVDVWIANMDLIGRVPTDIQRYLEQDKEEQT